MAKRRKSRTKRHSFRPYAPPPKQAPAKPGRSAYVVGRSSRARKNALSRAKTLARRQQRIVSTNDPFVTTPFRASAAHGVRSVRKAAGWRRVVPSVSVTSNLRRSLCRKSKDARRNAILRSGYGGRNHQRKYEPWSVC